VVDQLTSNLKGQQLQLVVYEGKKPASFGELARQCAEQGHMAIGLHTQEAEFNIATDRQVRPGDRVISIGESRIRLLPAGS
jgi:hypothetical protein